MNYAELRERVLDGDLIAFRSYRSLLGKVVRRLCGPYTHTGVAVWLEEGRAAGLFITEMDGAKNVLVPLSQYAGVAFDVYRCPVDRVRVREILFEELRVRVGYSWGDIWHLGRHFLLGTPLPPAEKGRAICSSQSAWIYLRGDWTPRVPLPSIPWPTALVRSIDAPIALTNAP